MAKVEGAGGPAADGTDAVVTEVMSSLVSGMIMSTINSSQAAMKQFANEVEKHQKEMDRRAKEDG